MVKYFKRKYIRKYKRPFTKKSYRKRKWIRGLKRFSKRLNQVAEKKLKLQHFAASPLLSAGSGGAIAQNSGIITQNIPALGSGFAERIGNKIFIRYIKLTFLLFSDGTHWTAPWIGMLHLKERVAGGAVGTVINTLFNGTVPQLNTALLKSTFSKMRLKLVNIQSINAFGNQGTLQGANIVKRVNYKFRIMKQCTIGQGGYITDIPDHYILGIYFNAPYSTNGINGPGFAQLSSTITYTDV